eukprot:Rmarinus@m.17913
MWCSKSKFSHYKESHRAPYGDNQTKLKESSGPYPLSPALNKRGSAVCFSSSNRFENSRVRYYSDEHCKQQNRCCDSPGPIYPVQSDFLTRPKTTAAPARAKRGRTPIDMSLSKQLLVGRNPYGDLPVTSQVPGPYQSELYQFGAGAPTFTFGRPIPRRCMRARFISEDLMKTEHWGKDSPGPIYPPPSDFPSLKMPKRPVRLYTRNPLFPYSNGHVTPETPPLPEAYRRQPVRPRSVAH